MIRTDFGSAPAGARQRLPQLDLLRGVAALSVVWVHYWRFPRDNLAALWPGFSRALESGDAALQVLWPRGWSHPGVVLFIVLSGFCIHLPQAGNVAAVSLREFLRRRFFRIFPVLAAAAGLGLLANALTPPPGNLWVQPAEHGLRSLMAALTALSAWWPADPPAGNPILQTVVSEMGLYLLYPALLPVVRRYGWGILLFVTAAISLTATAFTHYGKLEWAFTSTWGFLFFWWLGAFAAEWRARKQLLPAGRFWFNLTALAVAYVIFNTWVRYPAMSLLTGPRMAGMIGVRFEGAALLTGPCFALLCAALLAHIDFFRFRFRTLEWMGERSYSLYAVHMPAMALTAWALFRVSEVPLWIWMLAPLATAALIAWFSFTLIEAPGTQFGRRNVEPVRDPVRV